MQSSVRRERLPELPAGRANEHPHPAVFQFDDRGLQRAIVVPRSADVQGFALLPRLATVAGDHGS